MKCHKFYDDKFVFSSKGIPRCIDDDEIIKPDVVLYEEGLNSDTISETVNEIKNADMLIIAGTSLNVYPAASFINYFNGKHMVLINKSITPYDHLCDLVLHEKLGDVFSKIKEKI